MSAVIPLNKCYIVRRCPLVMDSIFLPRLSIHPTAWDRAEVTLLLLLFLPFLLFLTISSSTA